MQDTVSRRRGAVVGGVVAGVVGGAAIAVVLLIATLARGQDIWPVFKGAGAPFLGARAAAPGFDALAVIVGTLSHFAVSIAWGVLFGLAVHGMTKAATLGMGALWGVLVWFVMYYVVLPLVGLREMARGAPVGMAIFEHVIFGLALGIGFLPFQRTRVQPIAPLPTTTSV